MKIKKAFFLILLISESFFSFSQEFSVNGIVKDAKTNNPIIGAAVFELGDAAIGTATDTEGFFSLRFDKKHILLKVAYIGYRDTVYDLYLTGDTALIVNLTSETDLEEVEIEDDEIKWKPEKEDIVKPVMIFAGGADLKNEMLINWFYIPPAAETQKDINEIYIPRNTGIYGNIVFLDEALIYAPSTVSGLMPFIKSENIEAYDYFDMYFPARYGFVRSSLSDITVSEGNNKKITGEAEVSFLGAGFNIALPVKEERSSVFVSARKSFLNTFYKDLFLKEKPDKGEYGFSPKFWDFDIKYTHLLTEKSKFSFNIFADRNIAESEINESNTDNFNATRKYYNKYFYANTASSLNFFHNFSQLFKLKASLVFSSYNSGFSFSGDSLNDSGGTSSYIYNYDASYKSYNNDLSLKIKTDYNLNDEHYMTFGAAYSNKSFKAADADLFFADFEHSLNVDTLWESNKIKATEVSAYAGDKYVVNDNFFIDGELRFSYFYNNGKSFYSVDPGFFVSYKVFEFLTAKVSYSHSKEYTHLLSGNAAGFKADIFVPSSASVSPRVTDYFSAGADFDLPYDIKLTGNAFFSGISGFAVYKDGFDYFGNPENPAPTGTGIDDRIISADGKNFGAKAIIEKDFEKFSVQAGHTFSLFGLKSDSVNSGNTFEYENNGINNFNIKVKYKLNDNITIFADWDYSSGKYATLRKQYYLPYDYNNASFLSMPVYEVNTEYLSEYVLTPPFERNGFKLPAYHRLDIGADYTRENHKFGIHIYNVYNRKNPDLIDYERGVFTGANENRLVKFTSLPFYPTLYYSYKF